MSATPAAEEPPADRRGLSSLSLSLQLSLAFALILLVSGAAMGTFAYQRTREQASRVDEERLRLLSVQLAAEIDRSLASGRGLVRHLASTGEAQRFLRGAAGGRDLAGFHAWLDQQQGLSPGIAAVFALDPTGTIVASSNRAFVGRPVPFRTYFQGARQGRANTSDWIIGSVTKTPRVTSAAPVQEEGRLVGVLAVEFFTDAIEQAVTAHQGAGHQAALLNRDGIILVHTDPALQYRAVEPLPAATVQALLQTRQFLGRDIQPLTASPELARAFRDALAGETPHAAAYSLAGEARLASLSRLREQEWVAAVVLPEGEALRPAREVLASTLAAGLATTLLTFVLALALGRQLLRPIGLLSDAMARFGRGETSARAPQLPSEELSRLARTFNAMATSLEAHQRRLEEESRARGQALESTQAEMKTLRGLIPICAWCKQVRDDVGDWQQLERYLHQHAGAEFSHGICPRCLAEHGGEGT